VHDIGDKTISFQNLGVIQSAVRSSRFVARPTAMKSNHNRQYPAYVSVDQGTTDEGDA
jgi:hypothetical protein